MFCAPLGLHRMERVRGTKRWDRSEAGKPAAGSGFGGLGEPGLDIGCPCCGMGRTHGGWVVELLLLTGDVGPPVAGV